MARRRDIILDFVARLQAIAIADGFNTDAGASVYVNTNPGLGEDDDQTAPAAVAIMIQPDNPRGWQGETLLIGLPIEIQAHILASTDQAYIAAEDLLEDIKRAVELIPTPAEPGRRTLNRKVAGVSFERGSTRVLPREPGQTTVGLGILYQVPYAEKWGEP